MLEHLQCQHRAGVRELKEYALVTWLCENFNVRWSQESMLALFQKHFIVRHALYSARTTLWQQKINLSISPLGVVLKDRRHFSGGALPAEHDTDLSAFYLDLNNFYTANLETVSQWLDQFWRKFHSYQKADDAFGALGLAEDASWEQVQQAYRSLINQHHPDKGGDVQRFRHVRDAYEALKLRFER